MNWVTSKWHERGRSRVYIYVYDYICVCLYICIQVTSRTKALNESCHTGMGHGTYVCHDSFIYVPWLTKAPSISCKRALSFRKRTLYFCKRALYFRQRALYFGMTHGSWHTHAWSMAYIWMSHGAHTSASCHTFERVMSYLWMHHATHLKESCHTYEYVVWHIWMRHVTHTNATCNTLERVMPHMWIRHVSLMHYFCGMLYHLCITNVDAINVSLMGWLRLVGSIKSLVSFAKEPYKRDDILQKRPIILSILLTVATPYHLCDTCIMYHLCRTYATHMNTHSS